MNSRKAIYAMLAVGVAVILTLTFTPYALLSRARQAVASAVRTAPPDPALGEIARERSAPPPFDAGRWYFDQGSDPGRHAAHVESLGGRHVFASHNADAAYNPASLIKLATSLVALRRLGKDFRFETRVYAEGRPDDSGALRGRLVVAGNDPTFGDIAAVLVAEELEKRGIKKVAEEIAVTPSFSFNFSEKPEESAERLAKVMKQTPKKLGAAEAAPDGPPLFVLRSYPLSEILLYMNAHSSNFVAHRVGDLVGGVAGVQRFLVEELKLPADQVQLSTTSGLEHNRMTARGLLEVIRALGAEAGRQGLRLEDVMAVASDDWGTLRKRMVGTPLEGAVVGKTGTLVHDDGGMASLGGAIRTQKNGLVGFVVLNQGSSVAENKQLTDQLLVQIILSQDLPLQIPMPEERRSLLDRTHLLVQEQ